LLKKKNGMKALKIWLWIGLFMILIQIIVGGITRLTGSGLSITKWEIITGTFPPMTDAQWDSEFNLYKNTPQYEKINQGMSLSEFKFIYFWEYIHRLWARLMGFVFLVPFILFYRKGLINKSLLKRLILLVLFAALTASFGWIMVASGLIDRPWVNAYKLTLHLSIAISTLLYLLWIISDYYLKGNNAILDKISLRLLYVILLLISFQILIGGILSGIKGSLVYPTWPLMEGGLLPNILKNPSNWDVNQFIDYDSSPFLAAFIQLLHRFNGYIIYFFGILFFVRFKNFKAYQSLAFYFLILLNVQVFLGIYTLVNSIGKIPVASASLHQLVGILTLMILFMMFLKSRRANVSRH
jgi:heme a synthase